MTDPLPVHISRNGLHSLEVPASHEAEGSFDIRLINHAESLHIHLHLDDQLSEYAVLDAGNHFIEGNSERFVRIDVDQNRLEEEQIVGKIKIASSYGAETRWVDIELTPPNPNADTVQVDESLAEPQPKSEPQRSPLAESRLPVVALAGISLLVAVAIAVTFQEPLVTAGTVVVLAGVAMATVFLFRNRQTPHR